MNINPRLKHPFVIIGAIVMVALVVTGIYNKLNPPVRVAAPAIGPEDIIGAAMADVASMTTAPLYNLGNALTKKAHELAGRLSSIDKRLDVTNKRVDGTEHEIKSLKERELQRDKIIDAAKKRLEEKPLPKLVPLSELKLQVEKVQKEAAKQLPNFLPRPTA